MSMGTMMFGANSPEKFGKGVVIVSWFGTVHLDIKDYGVTV
jgi:hypothetical protein